MQNIKYILIVTLFSSCLFAATPEQVEQYISVSSSEEQLIELESQFSQMQESINRISAENSDNKEYDMQLLSIRFREYLQKNISEDEMDEILKAYRSVVLLKFVSVQNDSEYDEKEAELYVKSLENEENASVRMDLLEEISSTLYNKENIGILFDNLMVPFLKSSQNGQEIDDAIIKKNKDAYIKEKQASGKTETIYMTREFSIEELEALLEVVKSAAISHESKAVFGATAYALQEFFLSMASRYDVNKHKR